MRSQKTIQSILGVSISTCIFFCTLSVKASAGIDEHHVATSKGVIFSKEVSQAAKVCAKVRECWTPSRKEIEILEKDLSAFLAKSKVLGAAQISENLPLYKRKYYGFIKGRSNYIFVNGLCQKYWHPEGINFETPGRIGTDMGSCYFLIDYDVSRRQFSNFYVDGEG